MSDSNPQALFDYVADQLNPFGLAYLHIIEPRIKGNVLVAEGLASIASEQLRKIFKGKIIAAGTKVVLTGRREKDTEVVAEIKKRAAAASFFKADFAKAVEVQAAVNFTVSTYGRLDIAFHNAGSNVQAYYRTNRPVTPLLHGAQLVCLLNNHP
jgi:hypothetical protein